MLGPERPTFMGQSRGECYSQRSDYVLLFRPDACVLGWFWSVTLLAYYCRGGALMSILSRWKNAAIWQRRSWREEGDVWKSWSGPWAGLAARSEAIYGVRRSSTFLWALNGRRELSLGKWRPCRSVGRMLCHPMFAVMAQGAAMGKSKMRNVLAQCLSRYSIGSTL